MTLSRQKLLLVAGARPNFVKLASLTRALDGCRDRFEYFLLHTGQHYDDRLSKVFFDDLSIPRPHENLKVGSGSHTRQTAEIMLGFEPVLQREQPDAIVVVGDVNSTIACAIVASKAGVPVVHVEAGLRSFDRRMPEEINRVLTDSISDVLLVSERSGLENLRKEGVSDEKVHFVGNVMIDSLLTHREKADASSVLAEVGVEPKGYAVLTLHRPSNVDCKETLSGILKAVSGDRPADPRRVPGAPSDHPPRGGARLEGGTRRGSRTEDRVAARVPGLPEAPGRGEAGAHRLGAESRRRPPFSKCPASRFGRTQSGRSRSRMGRMSSWARPPGGSSRSRSGFSTEPGSCRAASPSSGTDERESGSSRFSMELSDPPSGPCHER